MILQIFAYLSHDILSLRQFRYPLKWVKYLEVGFCAVCCAVLLYDEYRLTSAGLICALLAMLLTGFAIGFVHPLDTSSIQACADHSSAPSLVKIVTVSFVITLGWCGKMEDTFQAAKHTLDIDPLVLGINIGSTMLAVLLGHSFILPVNIGGIFQISATIGFATIVGFASLHLATRSYVTELQLGAFYLTVICIIGAFQHARDADHVTLSGLLFPFHRLRPPPLSPDLIALDNEGDSSQNELTEEATDRFSHAISIKPSSIVSSISIAACLVAILAWIGFIVGNFAGDANTFHLIPRLDLAYTPEHGFDVVISMYDEPIESIQSIMNDLSVVLPGSPPRLFLYTKSEDVEPSILAALTNAFRVTKLRNYGREGETYLQHILLNWNSLAKHTLFVQADVHNPREIFHRIQDYYSPNKTGMLSLSFSGSSCSIENCSDRWGWYEDQAVLNDICRRVGEKPCTNTNLLLSYKGQFIVSAKRIRAVQREFYEYLRTAMTDPESWAHKEPYLQGRKDSLNAPQFGYTLERLWSLIMQCSTEEIAWKCPTLLSRTRRGGDLTDCQCLDP